jgi:pimeloyl-ACP methyl ester carboxylesterase
MVSERTSQSLRRLTVGWILFLCATVAAPGPMAQPSPRLETPHATPAVTGSYGVGRVPFERTDSSRRDPVDSTRARVVTGWIWYPAAQASARDQERALPGEWGDLRAAASAAKLGGPAAEAMRVLQVHATTGAPWAPAVARAPVLLFTPGNGWLPTDYSVLLEDLASHGYVVIGLAPIGLADVVRLRDGRTIQKTLGVGAAIGDDQVHAHRDALYLLSHLADFDADRRAPWFDHLDLGRIGALGHSLGGTTALVAAASDSLVRAAINLDGDAMGSVTEVRPRQPLLFVSSEVPSMSEAPPAPDSAWTERMRQGLERSERRRSAEWSHIASHASAAARVRLLGARHLNFTDAALVSPLVEGPQRRWMRWGPIDGARGLRITADLVRAFFDHTLLDRPMNQLLARPESEYPELRVVTDEPADIP